MSRVKIPVAKPMALLPHNEMAKVVVSAEAVRLTILLPIRIVVSNKSGFFAKEAARRLVRFFSVSSVRTCKKEREVNAVSEALKNAEKNNKTTINGRGND